MSSSSGHLANFDEGLPGHTVGSIGSNAPSFGGQHDETKSVNIVNENMMLGKEKRHSFTSGLRNMK
jgi:hypothetical protein